MPSWPAETKYISHSTPRIDGPAKVTGRARYSSDIQANGWLYGMILRSKWPAAKITDINLDKALQIPGIKAAVLARDKNMTVRYYGEEIAAVAGTSKQACLDALRAIEVHRRTTAVCRSTKMMPRRKMRRRSGKMRPMSRTACPANTAMWTRPLPNARR